MVFEHLLSNGYNVDRNVFFLLTWPNHQAAFLAALDAWEVLEKLKENITTGKMRSQKYLGFLST